MTTQQPLHRYDEGDLVRIDAEFRTHLDVLADPGTVSLRYIKPDGTLVTLEYPTDTDLVRDSLGVYHVDVTVDMAGDWAYNWTSTGAVTSSESAKFTVEGSAF